MYIRRRWILLFFTIVIVSGSWYLYDTFFADNKADQVCCKKHYLTVPKVLTITESTPIPILDSSKANQQITYNILNQVQEGLMRLGKDNNPVPGLAEAYQISPDYKTYTFTLREQAVWSDGQPVTAKDFQYAWLRALSPTNDYAFSYLFYGIQGAQSYAEGKIGEEKVGIEVTSDRQLTVRLNKPDPNFLSLVTLTPFLPLRQDLVEKYGEEYATNPETMSFTGPFKLKGFDPKSAVLIKNETYWDQVNVKIPEVTMKVEVDQKKQQRLFRSEETSMVKLEEVQKSQANLVKVTRGVSDFLEFNEKKRVMQNKFIRLAIQSQLQELEELPLIMTKASGIIPPVTSARNQQIEYSQMNSKQLLEKGLQELDIPSITNLSLLTFEDDRSIKLAIIIKNRLSKIGIPVTIRKLSPNKKTEEELEGNFDLSLSEWSLKYQDTIEFLSLWSEKSLTNISGFADPKYDSILQQASVTTDPTKRDQLLQQAERYLIVDQAAVVPLVYINDIRLQKPYVKNVLYHPFGADYSLKWASYTPPKQVEATK